MWGNCQSSPARWGLTLLPFEKSMDHRENAGKTLGMGAPYNNQPHKNTSYIYSGKKFPLKNGLLLPAFFPMKFSMEKTIHGKKPSKSKSLVFQDFRPSQLHVLGRNWLSNSQRLQPRRTDSHGIFAMRNCWLSHSGGGKKLRVTFKPMRPMVSKMKATFQRLGGGKNCQWFSPSQLQHPKGWEVPMYFAHTSGFRWVCNEACPGESHPAIGTEGKGSTQTVLGDLGCIRFGVSRCVSCLQFAQCFGGWGSGKNSWSSGSQNSGAFKSRT